MVVTPYYVSRSSSDSNLRTQAVTYKRNPKQTIPFLGFITMALPFMLLVLSFFTMIATSAVWASTFYVDATGGNNSNNGLSTGLPWKTIAKVNSSSFSAGDSILLKKGEMWRETLTVPSSGGAGNVITFGAYGSGANPIITGANNITGFSGGVTVWDASVTTRPYVVIVGSIAPKPMAASRGAVAAPGDWYWSANTLSVYAVSDPSGTVEAGARDNPVNLNNKTYITLDGLTIRSGNLPTASAHGTVKVGYATTTGIAIQNCTIELGASDGIDIFGTTTASDFTVSNNTIQKNGGDGIYVSELFAAGTISGNTIASNNWASIRDSRAYGGIRGKLGNVNIYGNTIHDNSAACHTTGLCHGIYVFASTAVANIYQNTIYNHASEGNGIKLIGSANVYRNTIYANEGAGIEAGQNGSTNVAYSIYYNLIYANNTRNTAAGIVEQTKGTGTISLTVINNTIYQNAYISNNDLTIRDDLTNLTLKNNLIYTSSNRHTMQIATQTGAVSIDYNLHWRADGTPMPRYAGADRTWSQWQGLGYDTHGVNSDPLLVSPTSNFALQSTSPAVNAGTDVGLSMDPAGQHVPVGASPDIGAYEWPSPLLAPSNLRVLVPN